MAQTTITVINLTRVDLAKVITHLAQHAKRQPRVIARMDCDKPTAWDNAHRRLDRPLDEYLAAQS